MTPERFAAIVQSYGARPAHWPADERPAALELIASGDAAAARMLAGAERLDATLDAYCVPAPHAALAGGILAAFPAARPRRRGWWSGIGLAGAGIAGALAGAGAVAAAAPGILDRDATVWSDDRPTMFGALDADEVAP